MGWTCPRDYSNIKRLVNGPTQLRDQVAAVTKIIPLLTRSEWIDKVSEGRRWRKRDKGREVIGRDEEECLFIHHDLGEWQRKSRELSLNAQIEENSRSQDGCSLGTDKRSAKSMAWE